MKIPKAEAFKKVYNDPKYDILDELDQDLIYRTQHGNEDFDAFRDDVLDNLPDYVEVEEAKTEFEKQRKKKNWMVDELNELEAELQKRL